MTTSNQFETAFEQAICELIWSCQCGKCGAVDVGAMVDFYPYPNVINDHICSSRKRPLLTKKKALIKWMLVLGVTHTFEYGNANQDGVNQSNTNQDDVNQSRADCAWDKYPRFVHGLSRVLDVEDIPVLLRFGDLIDYKLSEDDYVFVGQYIKAVRRYMELCTNLTLPQFTKYVYRNTKRYCGIHEILMNLETVLVRKNNKRISKVWEEWFMDTPNFTMYIQWIPREVLEEVTSIIGKPGPPESVLR